ncbi:MAG TPA: hypothetical protein VMW72_07170 [Sedimentisphaerales bacterium]|nr:hypothetical protein [Sedimentisphaerales bacterium]
MNKWIKYLLIVLEVGGGFTGISTMFLLQQWNTSTYRYFWWVFSIYVVFLFLFGIVAGLALVERPQLGAALSAVYQAFQIPVVSSPLLTYEFYSGLQLGFGLAKGGLAFFVKYGARFALQLSMSAAPWSIGVNALALALFVYLLLQLLPKAKAVEPSSISTNSSEIS